MPRVQIKPKKKPVRHVIADNGPSCRELVKSLRGLSHTNQVTEDAADKLEWLAKSYGLWMPDR
jgi:hypothetical protein